MRLYRKRASEFEWLADNYPISSVRLRYRTRGPTVPGRRSLSELMYGCCAGAEGAVLQRCNRHYRGLPATGKYTRNSGISAKQRDQC
jgi:hypothetical protein